VIGRCKRPPRAVAVVMTLERDCQHFRPGGYRRSCPPSSAARTAEAIGPSGYAVRRRLAPEPSASNGPVGLKKGGASACAHPTVVFSPRTGAVEALSVVDGLVGGHQSPVSPPYLEKLRVWMTVAPSPGALARDPAGNESTRRPPR
jgi:hypothetical protein